MSEDNHLDAIVEAKIKQYQPKNGLDRTAEIILAFCGINHPLVKDHNQRVSLLAEAVAHVQGKDTKAAFFAGLLHDAGKLTENAELFDGHDISQAEYEKVKDHALAGFKALRKHHQFVALCAGYHHAMCFHGYGLTADAFPKEWHMGTVKKILEISAILAVCDFIDAFTHRKTKIKDGSDQAAPDLKGMLYAKYPDDHAIIDIALAKNIELGFTID
ncbi:MAG: HD domain-containing protein [Candidatus Parcubacteria bacterium]|nr:HD domain-containing protein [Candidatus Parcubacteria bacterium]